MKRHDFNSFEEYEAANIPSFENPVCIHENGWWKADLLTDTKSKKVALNRFFRAFPEVEEYRDFLMENSEFHDKDCGIHFEVDCSNAEDGTIYIFLNIDEAGRGGL